MYYEKMNIVDFKKKFDPYLIKFLDKKFLQYKSYTKDPFILSLISHSKKLVMSAGKRVRPYVAYLMYKSAGGKEDEKAMKLFTALEFFHNFCLIHDDVIDRGSERHGVITLHELVQGKLREESRLGNISHIGNSQAILVGDLFFAWASEIFNTCRDFNSKKSLDARLAFNKMIDEVIIGQIIDVDITTRDTVGSDLIEEKMILKTAKYTFSRPMEIGLALAGSKKALNVFCENFGVCLGIGFQIQDDMLDIVSTPGELKKNIFSDLRERNHNFFTQYIFDFGTEEEKKELRKVFGGKVALLNGDRERVIDLFESSGAIKNGIKTYESYFDSARKALSKVKISKLYKDKWFELVDYIEKRSS